MVFSITSIDSKTTAITIMTHMTEHGMPNKLLSDHGLEFTSDLVKKVCRLSGVKQITAGSYYPQSNGTVERWNRTLGQSLRIISTDKGDLFTDNAAWDLFPKLIANGFSNKYSARIGMSPNQCYLGHNVRLPIDANTEITFMDENKQIQNGIIIYIKYEEYITRDCKIKIKRI